MKVTHWSIKNGSGMHRMAEEITKAEVGLGLDSQLLDGTNPSEVPLGLEADIHVVHTHLPDELDDRNIKKVFVAHGTPEIIFKCSINEMAKGQHGGPDGFMVNLYMIKSSDAVVTFWPRHQAIWESLMPKGSKVHCLPMGVNKLIWNRRPSQGKWNGTPSILTAENCHEIKWPLDLLIAMPWVMNDLRALRLHVIYLPLDQARWWGGLVFNNGSAYRSHISSMALNEEGLINAFSSVDFYIGLVRYGDHNRTCLEAKACGCPLISYRGNPYADYWVDEGDQRVLAEQLKMIFRGQVAPQETLPVPDITETAEEMKKIYEGLL